MSKIYGDTCVPFWIMSTGLTMFKSRHALMPKTGRGGAILNMSYVKV